MKKIVVVTFILFLTSAPLFSQVDRTSELFKTLKLNDSLLLDIGFNTCDIKQFDNLVNDNFEFYHDEAGIMSS